MLRFWRRRQLKNIDPIRPWLQEVENALESIYRQGNSRTTQLKELHNDVKELKMFVVQLADRVHRIGAVDVWENASSDQSTIPEDPPPITNKPLTPEEYLQEYRRAMGDRTRQDEFTRRSQAIVLNSGTSQEIELKPISSGRLLMRENVDGTQSIFPSFDCELETYRIKDDLGILFPLGEQVRVNATRIRDVTNPAIVERQDEFIYSLVREGKLIL